MSKDNDVTTLQEYIISGIVISFFGLLYFYLSGGFLSSDNKEIPIAASSQGYALTSLGSPDADKLSFQSNAKTPPTATPVPAKDVATSVEKTTPEKSFEPLQTKKSLKEDIDLDAMKAQVDNGAQKIDEVKRQLAAGALAVPAVASKDEKPQETTDQETTASGDLIFELPDGRKVEIPAEGFENDLRKAIVKGDRNTPIIFDRVYFDTGSKNLSSQSDYQITSTAALLNTYKDVNIVIRGHSDNRGSSKKNAQLSLFRSGSMKKALVDLGIDAKRIHIEGLGEVEPIDSNKTKRGRRNNRRIDLVIK